MISDEGRKIGNKVIGWDEIQKQEHGPEEPKIHHPYRNYSMIARYEALNLYPK
jgi:hypothetical protein